MDILQPHDYIFRRHYIERNTSNNHYKEVSNLWYYEIFENLSHYIELFKGTFPLIFYKALKSKYF